MIMKVTLTLLLLEAKVPRYFHYKSSQKQKLQHSVQQHIRSKSNNYFIAVKLYFIKLFGLHTINGTFSVLQYPSSKNKQNMNTINLCHRTCLNFNCHTELMVITVNGYYWYYRR